MDKSDKESEVEALKSICSSTNDGKFINEPSEY
jgi:hypothetical protein